MAVRAAVFCHFAEDAVFRQSMRENRKMITKTSKNIPIVLDFSSNVCYNICVVLQATHTNAGVMELADVTDSKSVDGDIVWVRVPPPAPKKQDAP